MDIGFQEFQKGLAFGIMSEWPILRSDGGDFGMSMHSRGFVRSPRCAACSVIRKRASSPQTALKKTICSCCGRVHSGWYDRRTRRVRDLSCGDARIFLEIEVRRVLCKSCGHVKRERLDFLADNPFYTKRFAYYVGRRCRQATIKDIAEELRLHWETIKTLEKQYMRAQLARVGAPGPKAIGIDEISIRKGHTYRIVVSDLIRGRPIWFGGEDRKEASMALFYDWLGEKRTRSIRLAVMDMWKPFHNVTAARAPQAAILYDKFHDEEYLRLKILTCMLPAL